MQQRLTSCLTSKLTSLAKAAKLHAHGFAIQLPDQYCRIPPHLQAGHKTGHLRTPRMEGSQNRWHLHRNCIRMVG